jgi:predicted ATPase/DNA-binding winged helix-turn-helix (wHTH) protein
LGGAFCKRRQTYEPKGRRVTGYEAEKPSEIAFGAFRLLPAQQLLLEGDKPVHLGSRARDILVALLERPGQVLGKQELLDRVWPNTFVEEGNLKVHVAALRRALGDGQAGKRFIANIPGRGYSFVAPVDRGMVLGGVDRQIEAVEARQDLPMPLTRMVGRSDTVAALSAQVTRQRFVTIVGAGGIGKTTVAVAVADTLAGSFKDGVRFVDLAPLSDPLLAPGALATVLGVGMGSDKPLSTVISFLREKHLLIVLDNCEHLVEAAARMAEDVLKGAPQVHILATSREALRSEGERVHRLAPLAFPQSGTELSASEALAFPSIQLFVERAAACLDAFELGDAEAPLVAEICRRLDGIALAIEIVAGRVDTFGVAGLAARLDERFSLLLRGRRTALPRHQTLHTTLDWSYDLLPGLQQVVLRRLAVFAGMVTMESASAILADGDTPPSEIVDAIADLIAKSLVTASLDAAVALYRLLDTTRAYALVKLDESGERGRFARRHAEHYRALLEQAYGEWEREPATDWLPRYRHNIDNVRAALDWAFSPIGDVATGVALTVLAIPLWFHLSLTRECEERVDRALAAPATSRTLDQEMRLHAARAWSLMQTKGLGTETLAAWNRTLETSERQENGDYQLRALWGLWAGLLNKGEFREALALARRFSELAATAGDKLGILVGDRMVGYILHVLGDQAEARHTIERMLGRYEVPVIGAQMIRFVFDQRAMARCFLARILWLQGRPKQAVLLVKSIVDGAASGNDTLTLCQVLVHAACPVALFVGDRALVERYVSMLIDNAAEGLGFWQGWGRCFRGVLLIERGDLDGGLAELEAALAEFREIQYGVYYIVFQSEFASALGRAGNIAEGLVAIDEALARSEQNDERWYFAEILRIKGELILSYGAPDGPREAELYYHRSLEWARRQQTIAWELRTATSLARLWKDQRRAREALALLAPIYDRFAEGQDTHDLMVAQELLQELRASS